MQFTRAFRKLFSDKLLSPQNGNCAADFDTLLVECSTQTTKEKNASPTSIQQSNLNASLQLDEADYQSPSVKENLIGANALTYVAGYLLRKCLQHHQCDICRKILLQNELDDPSQYFAILKPTIQRKAPLGRWLSQTTLLHNTSLALKQHLLKHFQMQ